jgi:tetratricopeptide (TPR) repeat protein
VHLAWHYLYTRQYDRAVAQLGKTLELDPSYALAHWYRGLAYEQEGMYPDALSELATTRNLLPRNLAVQSDVGHVYAVSGRAGEAERRSIGCSVPCAGILDSWTLSAASGFHARLVRRR